jgi:hypothetical protein
MQEEKAERTVDEINRKISELRNDWEVPPSEAGPVHQGREWDWHDDMNWPTLLREMPAFNLMKLSHFNGEIQCNAVMFVTEPIRARDIAEAVCLSWLKWKESQ